ncbi:SchA/CurD-like domain-containing protein [Actinoplanes siamensis]|uniref:SchA/CurD n=1 Tax=Actinoplanes siamensis TaxID=1223317 RepID=A0A919NA30_9ACTN|nr:SchA/CurD-like domain-containing protein [Actinoplanes siamensis]GIF07081.1 SchA/CurD [Actinoplanes siamensis]
MPYAAIMYRVQPGHDDEIAEIFAGFQRMDTPDFRDGEGRTAGRLLGTAVFVKEDVVVRIIHFEGDFAAIGRHVAAQRGVHLIEEKLQPFLATPRDTSSPEKFQAYFRDAVMRPVSQLSVETHPAAGA